MSSESLIVSCQSCGKALRLPAEHAGRAIKCPACGEIQQIPSDQVTATVPEKAAVVVPEAEHVNFACPECGKQMRARAEYAGQLTRCPKCAADVTIPGDANEEHRVRARPARRRRKVWPWVAAAACVLLLMGGALAWWLLRGRTDDLAYIPADAQAFVSIRVADLWNADLNKQSRASLGQLPGVGDPEKFLQEKLGLTPTDVERATGVVMDAEKQRVWLVVATMKPCDQKKLLSLWLPSAQEVKQGSKTYHAGDWKGQRMAIHFASERLFLVGYEEGIKYALDMPKKSSGPLEDALRLVRARHHVVVALAPRSELLRAVLKGRGDSPLLAAAADVKVATLTLDMDKRLDVAGNITFASESSARQTQQQLDSGLVGFKERWRKMRNDLPKQGTEQLSQAGLDQIDNILNSFKTELKGTVMTVRAQAELRAEAIAAAVQTVREAAALAATKSNLHQLAIALHNYADSYGAMLPAVFFSDRGRPLYSWRVAILPYIEHQDLYKQFHLNEPWDSPHNRSLIPLMPKVFASPDDPPDLGKTRYQVLTASFNQAGGFNKAPFTTQFRGGGPLGGHVPWPVWFTDGTSQTILIAEANRAVEWTKPEDIPFTTGENLKNQLLVRGNHFTVVMADSMIRSVPRTISANTLEAAVTPNAGDILGNDW